MWLAGVLDIDQNVIQIHHNQDIKHLSKDFVTIALKTSWCVGKAERYNLVLKVVVHNVIGHLSLIIFSNSHLMIGTSQVQLYKLLSLA